MLCPKMTRTSDKKWNITDMRILLLGEYSNVHATLAKGLRALGNEVTVASNGDFWKDYPRDIDLSRKPGKLGGISLYMKAQRIIPKLQGYDIVQLINPIFLELKAERLFSFYNQLRRNNSKIVLGGFGMDWFWVNTCIKDKPLRYSDFNIGDELRTNSEALMEREDWLGTAKERLNRQIAQECDGIVAGLYEYWACYHPVYPKKTVFIPYPIKMPAKPNIAPVGDKIKIFIGINTSRNAYKGTDLMLSAAEEVLARHPDRMELRVARSVPFHKYQSMMDGADAILDQLYSYTPSMNPLLAMSKGIVCIGGGEPENYEILGENTLRPIVNVGPSRESVVDALEHLVTHPEELYKKKRDSVEYIKRYHEYHTVARKYEEFYKSL